MKSSGQKSPLSAHEPGDQLQETFDSSACQQELIQVINHIFQGDTSFLHFFISV